MSLVTALFGWLALALKRKAEAETAASKAQTAMLKLGEIGLAMATDAWQTLAPAVQARVADGEFSVEDRKAIEAIVASLVDKYTSSGELQKIAEALGLPVPGIIAKIAAFIIDRVTAAHDPDILESAAPAAFPTGRIVDPSDGNG
jgi:hypothetical protein